MSNGCGNVLLYRGTGLISTIIKWQTRSGYSHAALLYPDGVTIIEAIQFHGVRKRQANIKDDPCDIFEVQGMTSDQWAQVFALAEAEIGCGYDYRSIFRFITRTKAGSPNRWFCSEFVFDLFQKVDVNLLARIKPWAVSPGHLALPPRLMEIPF
jgi:uncharacterized protein YycO